MKIRIESSGGIGNIRIKGELEFESLPLELQQQITHLLNRPETTDLSNSINQNLADGIEYDITIVPDNNNSETRQVLLSEAIHDKEIMRIGKTLLREVIKHRIK